MRYSIKIHCWNSIGSCCISISLWYGSVAHAAEVTEETSTNKIEAKQDNSTLGNNQIYNNNCKPVVTIPAFQKKQQISSC